jgi:hypothetical protein
MAEPMWEAVAAVATTASAIAAAIAAIYSAKSARLLEESAYQQRAADSFKKYHELALAYEKLSSGEPGHPKDWFVSFALLTAQDILRAYKNDEHWQRLVKRHMSYWMPHIKERWTDEELVGFGPDVFALIEELRNESAKL